MIWIDSFDQPRFFIISLYKESVGEQIFLLVSFLWFQFSWKIWKIDHSVYRWMVMDWPYLALARRRGVEHLKLIDSLNILNIIQYILSNIMISPLFFLEIESILILDTNSETPLPPENVCIVISVVTTIYDVIMHTFERVRRKGRLIIY